MVPRLDQRIPFPQPVGRDQPRDVLFRAAAATWRGHVLQRDPEELTKNDAAANLVLRAAKNPAMTGTGAWANQLAATAVDDMLVGLAGPCAAAELRRFGLRVDFGNRATVSVPARVVNATDCGFVAEGDPIPVKVLTLSAGASLAPTPLAVIVVFSNLVAETSNAERVITQMLGEAVRLKLDAEMFSTTAGSASRPAGLLNGVTPITATTAGSECMEKDIAQLVAALNTAGGGASPVFICSLAQAATLKLRASVKFDYPILASGALANGTIVAVEAGSFVSAFDPVPQFDVSNTTALHLEDTSPAPLATGTGPTVATPIRSLYQTVCSALKMILPCSWGMRATGHVQVINSCNW
jgi:hypothetical protein